jgi:2-oxoglutarate ferredoxin oxidoreductase subunit beta
MAINLGCTFVARSFSGAKKQLTSLIRAAMSHRGTAVIDVISPCVTFANNDEFFRSYGYVKDNDMELHAYDYIPHFTPLEEVEIPEGEFQDITLFDGSTLRLETVESGHDTSDAVAALSQIHKAEQEKRHVTGLLYYNPAPKTLDEWLELSETPLADLSEEQIRPSEADLAALLAEFRE